MNNDYTMSLVEVLNLQKKKKIQAFTFVELLSFI